MLCGSSCGAVVQFKRGLSQRALIKKFAISRHHFLVGRYFLNEEFGIEPCGNTFSIGIFFRAHDECHIARAPEDL